MNVKRGSKREMIDALWKRHREGTRVQRGRILDEVRAATGYHRKYCTALFGKSGLARRKPRRRVGRPKTYGEPVIRALEVAATATGWICGKRLAPFLSELVPALEREGTLVPTADLREALVHLSPATIDRRLAFARKKAKPQGLGTTKPGSILKRQIPVRTYTPRNEERPGFCEIDLVGHCGETVAGSYLCTLDVTDVATGWTECAIVANKGQRAVVAALEGDPASPALPSLGVGLG